MRNERLIYMKSLVEEASSIAKAIEKAWERAGKPHNFSVKIYETGEKNFLGFSKKSAKVGIFFEEERAQHHERQGHTQQRPSYKNRPQQQPYTERLERRSTHRTESENAPEYKKQNVQSDDKKRPVAPRQNNQYQGPKPATEHPVDTEQKQTTLAPEQRYQKSRNPRHSNNDRRQQQRRGPSQTPRNASAQNIMSDEPKNDTPAQQQTFVKEQVQNTPSDRPVVSVAASQATRKVLKVSSRRYTAQKQDAAPSESHNKDSEVK